MTSATNTRPTLRGSRAMVSSTHWLASAAGMAVLESGGNAFDAAVAAGFVLQVVQPHLNGPGGEVPAIVAAAGKSPRVLMGQGPAPLAASAEHYKALGLDLVPGAGPLAAAVPGAFDAWMLLLRDEGTMRIRQVVEPAIELARTGHPIGERTVATIAAVEGLFREDWTASASIWLPGGRLPRANERFAMPAWADTLQRLVDEAEAGGGTREAEIDRARRAWREGFVAEAVDRFGRQAYRDSSGGPHAGVLSGADLASWRASWEQPVTYAWRGYTLAKTAAWAQGPVLLQSLALIEAASAGAVVDPGTEEGAHLVAECLKLALADREAWYGDGAQTPLEALLSPTYNASRIGLIGDRASFELRPGAPDGRRPLLGHLAVADFAAIADSPRRTDTTLAGATGEPTVDGRGVTRGDTVHVDVVDRFGNMISATPSGGWLQSSPAIPELGFCLGSRLQMTWIEQGLASSLVPGRRPRSTLSPTLVLRDGEAVLACGTPGGDQQDQWQLLFLLRHLGMGMGLQESMEAPTWHSESFPSSFYPRRAQPGVLVAEPRLGDDVIAALERRGHSVVRAGEWSLGRMCAVAREPASGLLSAAADPRGQQGYAAGR